MAWVDAASHFTFSGAEAHCSSKKGGTPFCAMWKGAGAKEGTSYTEFKLTSMESGCPPPSFGLTDEKSFAAGWGLKGMLFNGNVTNGGGCLIAKFGDKPIKAGDTVGVLAEFKGTALSVIFFHNGKCLGPAFEIADRSAWEPLHPMISCQGGEKITVNDKAATPSERKRAEPPANAGLNGVWYCEEFGAELETTGDENKLEMKAVICNSMMTTAKKEGDKYKATPVAATLMMGDDDQMKHEASLLDVLNGLDSIVVDGSNLVISGAATATFKPHKRSPPAPVPENQLKGA
eukprot:GHVN01012795.1.p1 GENE.GHVN01012795.1~~GHVN01012795.1.p1  ORF type:complete len:290 (+),score=49.17 GHVN01012795.1:69-938(+)